MKLSKWILSLALAAQGTLAVGQDWYQEVSVKEDGFCPMSGMSPCWAALDASLFKNCCSPYASVTVPTRGYAHYEIDAAALKKLNGKSLREVVLNASSKRSLQIALGKGDDEFEIPWWLGFFDRVNALTVIDGLQDLTKANRESAARVRENVANGGKLALVTEVEYDKAKHPWLWKRVIYSVKVGSESRTYYLGGAGAPVHVVQ